MENKKMKTNGEKVREILALYFAAEIEGVKAQKLLEEIHGAPNIAVGENEIPATQRMTATENVKKGVITGDGLMNTGSATMEKVHVTDGKIDGDGLPGASVFIGDKMFLIAADGVTLE